MIPEIARAVTGHAGPNRTERPAALSRRANRDLRDPICHVRATEWRPSNDPSPTSRLTRQCPFSRSRPAASVSGAYNVRSRRVATLFSPPCPMSAASYWWPFCTHSERAHCDRASAGYDVAGRYQPRPGLWHRRARPTPALTSRRGRGLTDPRSGVHASGRTVNRIPPYTPRPYNQALESIRKSQGLFHRLRAPTLSSPRHNGGCRASAARRSCVRR
jgi:hypothetical protein